MWSGYGAIAVACLMSSPVLFVVCPLLVLDVGRSAWRRSARPRTVGALVAGMVALAHLYFFVLPQNQLRTSAFWNGQFLPHHGLGAEFTSVWQGLRAAS